MGIADKSVSSPHSRRLYPRGQGRFALVLPLPEGFRLELLFARVGRPGQNHPVKAQLPLCAKDLDFRIWDDRLGSGAADSWGRNGSPMEYDNNGGRGFGRLG